MGEDAAVLRAHTAAFATVMVSHLGANALVMKQTSQLKDRRARAGTGIAVLILDTVPTVVASVDVQWPISQLFF